MNLLKRDVAVGVGGDGHRGGTQRPDRHAPIGRVRAENRVRVRVLATDERI
jgi:hypothetical protein